MAQINKPNLHFDSKIYLGSSNAVTVSGLGFQPDWVWIKDRDNGNNHCLVDAVRGVGKYIQSDNNSAEINNSTNSISAFTSDGFTTGTANPANESASTTNGFISWNWKAGTTGSGTTSGSGYGKAYSYSVNTTAGFSIITYKGNGTSGHTIPHHLGATPKLIIVKNRDTTDNWEVYHSSLGAEKYLELNLTATQGDSTAIWNDTEPTSSVFTIGDNGGVNTNDEDYIAYVFAEINGYSKISSYKGNGNSTNGPFVYTGFKPAFIIGKKANGNSDNWYVLDNKRIGFNERNYWLYPNLTNTEYGSDEGNHTAYHADLLSNGFKIRSSDDMVNGNSNIYVFWAFAAEPLVGTNKVPAVAR